ncbi:hypothetical protein I0C86_42140 [Plantactinospora sp. S1510]|uniref:Uncharacterized protein n=1 Tax=Plantactinospora alkalitolerans TaxID=2789879 RepID=A0ABS0HAF9_9ACTN|nr:hypothetical protein [Plantactinospora alkalitolerans]MBF9135456.1 hypothetical protein [Plantactinospora alkalitolerans]
MSTMISTGQLPELVFTLALSVALAAMTLGVLYWVIRLAVRHAIEDADRRRTSQRR